MDGPDLDPTAEQDLLDDLYALVDEQAEDEGLWSTRTDGTLSIAEAYLQQELRRLHALIESRRES